MISSGIDNIRNQIESVSFGSELKSKFQIGANFKRNAITLGLWGRAFDLKRANFTIIYYYSFPRFIEI